MSSGGFNPLFCVPPEMAHGLVIFALKHGLVYTKKHQLPECLNTQLLNLRLRTPIGLAAGFDKNAEVIKPMTSLGFGFVEVGTTTRNREHGNKGTRIFRIPEQKAVVNCLGFNNKGVQSVIKKIDSKELNNITFGVNVGASKECKDPPEEYAYLVKSVYGLSNYITLNISSPNTEGLRELQKRTSLSKILASVRDARYSVDHAESVPIFLKISPDISDEIRQDIVDEVIKYKINGLIVSNTTTNFQLLDKKAKYAKGGLSGQPLFDISTRLLSEIYSLTRGSIALIGCGGVSNGKQALQKIKAGASLVQLYTALVYEGLGVVHKINLELADLLTSEGFRRVEQAVGIDA